MKGKLKKLVLARETVRALQDADLRHIAGGAAGPGFAPGHARPGKIIHEPCGSTCTGGGDIFFNEYVDAADVGLHGNLVS